MVTAEAWGWIDAPVSDVSAVVSDAQRLSEWFSPVRETLAGSRLAHPGDRAVVALGAARTTVSFEVARRVRDVVHIELDDGGRLCLSLSPWNGGTAVELSLDVDGRFAKLATCWQLTRAIRRLDAVVGAGAAAADSDHGRRRRLVPGGDAATPVRP